MSKGVLRKRAIVPMVLLVLVTFLYFHFLFDYNIKKLIEWGGSYIYGAEVDVGSVETGFMHLSFALNDLQVTDKDLPERNLVSVGKIRFVLTPDALLRAKFVVDDASILDIEVYSPRLHPGYVKPPSPPTTKEGPSIVDDIERHARLRFEEQNKNNVFASLSKISNGAKISEQLKEMQEDLISQKNILELQKYIQQTQENIKSGKEKITQIKSDYDHIINGINSINSWVQQDVDNLKKKLNIPSLDAEKFSEAVFISLIDSKIGGAEKYITMAREYMPAKKSDSEKSLVARTRAQGRMVTYPITKGYPLFWLKHAEISSRANTSEFSGDVSGQVTNVTTSPKAIGEPAIIELKGNFPKQNVMGVEVRVKIDHTQPVTKESFYIKAASYAIEDLQLTNNDALKIILKKSQGAFQFGGEMQDKKIKMAMQNIFQKNDFNIDAKQEFVQKTLQNVFATLPQINLKASINGTFDNLETRVESNLGTAIADSFKKVVEAQFAQANKAIQDAVQEKIRGPRDELILQANKFRSQENGKNGKQNLLNNLKNKFKF